MQASIHVRAMEKFLDGQTLEAAVCENCGAKIYPARLMKTHQHRHRLLKRWFNAELKRLQESMKHMRAL
jgi:hypothetical protein